MCVFYNFLVINVHALTLGWEGLTPWLLWTEQLNFDELGVAWAMIRLVNGGPFIRSPSAMNAAFLTKSHIDSYIECWCCFARTTRVKRSSTLGCGIFENSVPRFMLLKRSARSKLFEWIIARHDSSEEESDDDFYLSVLPIRFVEFSSDTDWSVHPSWSKDISFLLKNTLWIISANYLKW